MQGHDTSEGNNMRIPRWLFIPYVFPREEWLHPPPPVEHPDRLNDPSSDDEDLNGRYNPPLPEDDPDNEYGWMNDVD